MDHIEEIIKRAQEQGAFDNLPGAGKPLDLRENPFVPEDWRLAYRMLAGQGFAPTIVEDNKALRARIEALETSLSTFTRRWESQRSAAPSESQRAWRLAARQTFLQEYQEEIQAINSRIHSFNASAPRAMARGTLPTARLMEAAISQLPLD